MAEEMKDETIIESFLRAVENTKSTTEFKFEDLEIGISSIKTKIVVTGKISIVVKPIHD